MWQVIFSVGIGLIAVSGLSIPENITERAFTRDFAVAHSSRNRYMLAKKAGPSVGTAPLDVDNEIASTLATVSSLVGILGGSSSKLVMGLTGVSLTDCAGSLKGVDLDKISCAQFLDTISDCDSLSNIKDLLQAAKAKYQKKPNSKAPCFKKGRSKKSKKP